ncbi:phytase [Streptomyces sp. BR123]|nr:phytase [Streptomyces sp. BR123]
MDATAADLGPAFPQGVFVCQDGSHGSPGTSGNQNFKFAPLQRITAHFG